MKNFLFKIICLFITFLICLTSVSCRKAEVNETAKPEIKPVSVNVKEILKNTSAEDIAELFPDSVSKIVCTSFVSKSNKKYVFDDEKSVIDFVKLLSETYFGEPEEFEDFGGTNAYFAFDFYDRNDESSFKIKMCNDTRYIKSKTAIVTNGEEKHFYISNSLYRKIIGFATGTYYLHDSKIKNPDKDFFNAQKEKVLSGIDEDTAKTVKEKIRKLHYETEIFLLQEVSYIKETDSIYWDYIVSGETFTDPISKQQREFGIYNTVKSGLEFIISKTEDETAKDKLSKALKLFENSVKEHSLEGLFKVHECLHDYDYFAFNYPTQYVYDDYADYQGLDDYFGNLGEVK